MMKARECFLNLCEQLQIVGGESVWLTVQERYSEPHRSYHNLCHIESMLDTMDRVGAGGFAMELAIWFHDVVYDPKARNNEELSAVFFETSLGNLLDVKLTERVAMLILATDHARVRTGDPEEDLIRDIDLSILASSPEEYANYSRAIRSEYAHIPDDDFSRGRRAVLEYFLSGRIFQTAAFVEFEEIARKNLQAEIEAVQNPPVG